MLKLRRLGLEQVGMVLRDTCGDRQGGGGKVLEDGEDSRTRISQRVTIDSQWVDLLMEDMIAHQETILILSDPPGASIMHTSLSPAHQTQLLLQSTRIQTLSPEHEIERWWIDIARPELMCNNECSGGELDSSSITMLVIQITRMSSRDAGVESSKNGSTVHTRYRRECAKCAALFSFADFIEMSTLNFKGTEGVVGLTRAALYLGGNSQIRTLGPEAYSMTWEVLKKKMTDKYCPQDEIKKLEIELWNLKVKGNDVPTYTERFQELTLICTKFVANETERLQFRRYYRHGLVKEVSRRDPAEILVGPLSHVKGSEYMAKGCQTFLAQISAKKEEDKSEGKQLKDVPIVRDFSEVFPEDLPGLPPARPVDSRLT
ncbi:reverse transcriptase domain-containing protein [Tanacetum coccineum]